MSPLLSTLFAFCLAVSVLAIRQVAPAEAGFHCMRIHAVMGGFSGNAGIQYVELRMDAPGQIFISGHTIQFFDAGGTIKASFTFPSGITNSSTGESILIATSEFNSNVTGGAADFVFSGANTVGMNGGDPLHPIQGTNGTVVFASGLGGCAFAIPVDAVAYGSGTGGYGAAAAALPNNLQSLRLSNLNTTPSNNSIEYSLQNVSTSTFAVAMANLAADLATPRNNGRTVLKLNAPVAPVGGVAEDPASVAAPAATGTSSGTNWAGYVLAGGIAAAALATAGGWYVFRRREA